MDVLALGSMKTAAKRDIQWELQKHETHQVVERICGLGSPMPIGSRVSLTNLILPRKHFDAEADRNLVVALHGDSAEV